MINFFPHCIVQLLTQRMLQPSQHNSNFCTAGLLSQKKPSTGELLLWDLFKVQIPCSSFPHLPDFLLFNSTQGKFWCYCNISWYLLIFLWICPSAFLTWSAADRLPSTVFIFLAKPSRNSYSTTRQKSFQLLWDVFSPSEAPPYTDHCYFTSIQKQTIVFHTDMHMSSVRVANYWCFTKISESFYCSVTLTGLTDFVRKATKTTATGTQPTYSVYSTQVVQKNNLKKIFKINSEAVIFIEEDYIKYLKLSEN